MCQAVAGSVGVARATGLALIFLLLQRAQASCERRNRLGSLGAGASSPSVAAFLRFLLGCAAWPLIWACWGSCWLISRAVEMEWAGRFGSMCWDSPFMAGRVAAAQCWLPHNSSASAGGLDVALAVGCLCLFVPLVLSHLPCCPAWDCVPGSGGSSQSLPRMDWGPPRWMAT